MPSNCFALVSKQTNKQTNCNRKRWIKDQTFTHLNLLNKIKKTHLKYFNRYFRTHEETFNKLLNMVRPFIAKRNTVMRGSISANERLAIALCYLVSRRSFNDLQYSGIMATSTFSLIVQETYEGIIIALHDYIKVAITRLIIACNVQFIFNNSFELHDIDYQKFGCTGIHENIELGVPVESQNAQMISAIGGTVTCCRCWLS